ncbi:hypothetical protein Ae201684P_001529 [Aphanomyces euteiches]|nr:hypothetical protein Ae201684P_001529 [Aphanomyces euteiches]
MPRYDRECIDYVKRTSGVVGAESTNAASSDDVARFFYLDSPQKLEQYAYTMGQKIADRRNLYTMVKPEVNQVPTYYCGIAWVLHDIPKLVSARDMCCLEYHNEIEMIDDAQCRRRGWVRCMHSIDLRCCPPLKASHGIVRGSISRTGHIFLETDVPGVLELYSVVIANAHGNLIITPSPWLWPSGNVKWYSIWKNSFRPVSESTFCTRCRRHFGIFMRKFHCRMCFQVWHLLYNN